jgi:hypothetical protein
MKIIKIIKIKIISQDLDGYIFTLNYFLCWSLWTFHQTDNSPICHSWLKKIYTSNKAPITKYWWLKVRKKFCEYEPSGLYYKNIMGL